MDCVQAKGLALYSTSFRPQVILTSHLLEKAFSHNQLLKNASPGYR